MQIGSSSGVSHAAIQRKARQIKEKSEDIRKEREKTDQGVTQLDNYAPGSSERKALGSLIGAGVEKAAFQANELGREKAELARMRLQRSDDTVRADKPSAKQIDKAGDEVEETAETSNDAAVTEPATPAQTADPESVEIGQVVDTVV